MAAIKVAIKKKLKKNDPLQVFQVVNKKCTVLYVTVLEGRNITKGKIADMVDTPDPFIYMTIKGIPSGKQKSSVKSNEKNPVWNETFQFLLDPDKRYSIEVFIKEWNLIVDGTLHKEKYNLNTFKYEKKQKVTLKFNKVSEVDIEFLLTKCAEPDLRFSVDLPEEEETFRASRRVKVMEAMKNILGEQAPRGLSEVPTIAVMGSGGAFRAMIALSGVFKALSQSGILDMVTYVSGLSGSTWYLSQLYAQPDYPSRSPPEFQESMKMAVTSSPAAYLMDPVCLLKYAVLVQEKFSHGQPVSIVDFYGHMLGEFILREQYHSKLSDQRHKLEDAATPLPLYAGLNVSKGTPATEFHDYVEFSPYEIGTAKYGTFMKTEDFGSKFYLGKILKKHDEVPLHFLQGIWGSFFSIDFGSVVSTKDEQAVDTLSKQYWRRASKKIMKNVREDAKGGASKEKKQQPSADNSRDLDVFSSPDSSDEESTITWKVNRKSIYDVTKELQETSIDESLTAVEEEDENVDVEEGRKVDSDIEVDSHDATVDAHEKENNEANSEQQRPDSSISACGNDTGALAHQVLDTACVHNFLRGLSLKRVPHSGKQAAEKSVVFRKIFKRTSVVKKKMRLADAGLCFNSPYPLILRTQRKVNLILSFDFSAKESDNPTEEEFCQDLIMASKWAKLHNLPFPKIDLRKVRMEGRKECYVFRDNKDPNCPIILHFPLINNLFKVYKAPGVLRTTQEETDEADFCVFDKCNFGTFDLAYDELQFDRLVNLMEFNTLLNKELILLTIQECIKKLQKS